MRSKSPRSLLWASVIVTDFLGLTFLALILPNPAMESPRLLAFLIGAVLITTSITAAPFIAFVSTGWQVRFDEIRNNLSDGKLRRYLAKFWRLRVAAAAAASKIPEKAPRAAAEQLPEREIEELFSTIYNEQYGRHAFLVPVILLVAIVFVEATMIILVRRGVLVFGGIEEATIKTVIAATAGAYMFAIGDTIDNVRRRSLNTSDVYYYALRMLLAYPIGASISILVAPQLGAFIAFGVALLPISELNKLIQRLTYQNLNQKEAVQDSDQLIRLEGVTVAISSQLAFEGVTSIDQLICMDPVLLAIRTGLPFDLILRLADQAITGRYLTGELANKLPGGLGNASAISKLVDGLNNKCPRSQKILEDAASRGSIPAEMLEFDFRRIANDDYTQFLMSG